eukprot:SAG31_NODE_6623_length_1946_cov_4.991337_1_plen_95_part_00
MCYDRGEGAKHLAEAVNWFEKAEQGYNEALYNLGSCYRGNGGGAEEEGRAEQAMQWFDEGKARHGGANCWWWVRYAGKQAAEAAAAVGRWCDEI